MIATAVPDSHSSSFYREDGHESRRLLARERFSIFRREHIAPKSVGRNEIDGGPLFICEIPFVCTRTPVGCSVETRTNKRAANTHVCSSAATSGRAKSISPARGWSEVVCSAGRFPRRYLRLLRAYVPITGEREKNNILASVRVSHDHTVNTTATTLVVFTGGPSFVFRPDRKNKGGKVEEKTFTGTTYEVRQTANGCKKTETPLTRPQHWLGSSVTHVRFVAIVVVYRDDRGTYFVFATPE